MHPAFEKFLATLSPTTHPFWIWITTKDYLPEVDRVSIEGPDVVVTFVDGSQTAHRIQQDLGAVHVYPGIAASPVEAEVVQ